MFKLNPSAYAGVFVMPSEIADKHLKMASESMLKVIIYACRRADAPFSVEDIAAGTGLGADEAADGIAYWCGAGFLQDCEALNAAPERFVSAVAVPEEAAQEKETAPLKQEAVKSVSKIKPGRLSYQQICARLEESDIVRELFREAQAKLGRTIGTADQSALLNLHDYYGMPVEVILAICEYAATHGKSNNINYIYTVGADWSMREIDTIEAADEEFRRLEQISAVWEEFRRLTGVTVRHPTSAQSKYLNIWTLEWKFSINMIAAAYEEMSRYTDSTSFPYMNRILAGWHSAGVKTVEEAQELNKKHEQESALRQLKKSGNASPYGVRSSKSAEPDRPASYDIEKATEMMNTTVPRHKKKEKR